MMTTMLKKIIEMADVRDKNLLNETIKQIEKQEIIDLNLKIFSDHVIFFTETVKKDRHSIHTFVLKGDFRQLPKQEMQY